MLYSYHPAPHSHWGHCPDSWTSPNHAQKKLITYCFQSSSLMTMMMIKWTDERLTGITLGLLDKRSREVTWRVWSSVHRTSSVNSTEHSGQKSSQVQSWGWITEKQVSVTHWLQWITYQQLALTLEYCSLSTMSSLVRGMRPDKIHKRRTSLE